MTRQEIEAEYKVVNGIIRSPGKFEGEPVYAPYFWNEFLEGAADEDDGSTLTFDLIDDDFAQFPELRGLKRVRLVVDDQGFVHTR